jgi:ABC-type sugar transport system permease subunit
MTRPFRERLWACQQKGAPYLFVAPFVLLFCTFGLYPLVNSLVLAFHITAGPKAMEFCGFDNFRFLLADPDFYKAVWNTAVFAFFSVFLQLPLSLGLALLLNARWLKGREFFRFVFFSPRLMGTVFVALLFGVLFAPRLGLVNRAMQAALGWGIETKWLGDSRLVMAALVLTALWMYVGFNMIYFLAALQAVDRELYEAAEVDGANAWQKFRHVTVPGIKPVAVFVVLMSTIGSFQLFELPYVMLRGAGPDRAGLTIVMYLYDMGFGTGDLGYASAIGWTLTFIVLLISLLQLRVSGTLRKEA